MSIRQEKVAELLKKLAAEYLVRESNTSSLITVTRTDVASNLRRATIYFTVLPESEEDSVVEFLSRKEYDFKEYVKKHTSLQFLPITSFVLDLGEKNRIKIEELSRGE
ncbi:MAG: ribosome-binding factor A [Candidatus Paceibacterota bacterium]